MGKQFIVERGAMSRFPFRVRIADAGRDFFAVRAAAPWPTAGHQVFCLRDRGIGEGEQFEEVERVPVVEYRQFGAKLSFSLDRPTRKRAEFLVLTKGYKGKDGSYEQIFFRTQLAVEAHRGKGRPALHGNHGQHVVIDAKERYGWKFPEAVVSRRTLPAGDYALLDGEKIIAVVERKTLPGLLTDIYSAQVLQHKLGELATYARAVVVVEAQYADLFSAKRTNERCSPAHLARMVAEFAALHPRVQLVWAGNRKMAEAWTQQFFVAVARADKQFVPDSLADLQAAAEPPVVADGGMDQRIRQLVRFELGADFTAREVSALVPEADVERVRRLLNELRAEGVIERFGHGRGARWRRVTPE